MTVIRASFTDVFSSALRGEECEVVGLSARPRLLPITAWNQVASSGDRAVLAHCLGPTLDIGCGPGRMSECLAELGHAVLGIDVVAEAVAQTRGRGVSALHRDVFDRLPGEGRWTSALLADGNIGIGGNPHLLLARVFQVLAPGGRVVVDLAGPGVPIETRTVHLSTRSSNSRPFRWSVVGVDAIGALAVATGFSVWSLQSYDGRWFAVLKKGQ